MADQDGSEGDNPGQVPHPELTALVRRLVGKSVEEVIHNARALHALADALDGFGDLQRSADADTLRSRATGIQALSVQAVLTACQTIGASERLGVCAQALEAIELP